MRGGGLQRDEEQGIRNRVAFGVRKEDKELEKVEQNMTEITWKLKQVSVHEV